MQIKKTLTSDFYVLNACSCLGSRYYNPRESVWLSVDPLAEQTGTPYQYCYQNPVNFIDPKGMKGDNDIHYDTGNKQETVIETNDESDRHFVNGKQVTKEEYDKQSVDKKSTITVSDYKDKPSSSIYYITEGYMQGNYTSNYIGFYTIDEFGALTMPNQSLASGGKLSLSYYNLSPDYSDFENFQTVNTNYPLPNDSNPKIDKGTTGSTFYNNTNDRKTGSVLNFSDNSKRESYDGKKPLNWEAELSVTGVKNNVRTNIVTFKWGFTRQTLKVGADYTMPHVQFKPTPFHLNNMPKQ